MFRNKTIHVILFFLTVLTTFFVGYLFSGNLISAALYSGALMSILFCHEMGHFLMARKYGVPATLPFFIPVPFFPFGTLGAVIKMQGNIPDRRALLDIGAAGPLAGLAVSIPVIFIGIKLSTIIETGQISEEMISLGDSLLFSWLSRLAIGKLPEGQELILHPLAYAGWVGFLVTAMNLLPVGQLDGGHIIYSLFHKRSRFISFMIYGMMVYVFLFHSAMWMLWLILLGIFHRHPPTLHDALPLDSRRKWLGSLTLLAFVLTFTPAPFAEVEGFIKLLPQLLGGSG
jgi:membrane-associated protease RseP (regulator of RpoE activity)